MRRGLFGSSPSSKRNIHNSHSNSSSGNGVPSSSSSSSTTKPRNQHSHHQDKRRSFAFMRYGSNRPTNKSMRRTREHSRQIAMQLSQQEKDVGATSPDAKTPRTENHGFFNSSTSPVSPASALEQSPQKSFAQGWGSIQDVSPKASLDSMDKGKREDRQRMTLDAFVEKQQQKAATSSKSAQRHASGAVSVVSENGGRERYSDRTVHSMPTLPSNSTMLARNVTASPRAQSTALVRTPSNSSMNNNHTNRDNAAARRRMRTRQRESMERKYQSVAGTSSDLFDDNSFPSMGALSTESSRSVGSFGSGGNKPPPRQSPRQTPPLPPATPGAVSTSNSMESGQSQSQQGFVMMDADHGFSFDAFGLDASQVDREVNAAIQDLAGDHPDLFFGQDEFPMQSFDSPPGSRASSPDNLDEDGFENGFRISGLPNLPLHVKQSPASSDRSSLTSSTEKPGDGRANRFKEQAGFFRSKASTTRPPPSPSSPAFQNPFGSPQRQKTTVQQFTPSQQHGFGTNDFAIAGGDGANAAAEHEDVGDDSGWTTFPPPSSTRSEPGGRTIPRIPQLDVDDNYGFGDF